MSTQRERILSGVRTALQRLNEAAEEITKPNDGSMIEANKAYFAGHVGATLAALHRTLDAVIRVNS